MYTAILDQKTEPGIQQSGASRTCGSDLTVKKSIKELTNDSFYEETATKVNNILTSQ